MKLSTVTLIWTDNFNSSHLDLIPKIKEHGFDGVEIITFRIQDVPVAKTREALARNELGSVFTTALIGDLSFVSEDASTRSKAVTYIKDRIKFTADLGSKVFCGPFYAPIGYMPGRRRTEDEWKRVVESLQSVMDTAVEYGVSLGVEPLNRYESYFLNTVADAVALCDEINHPNMGILFDTYHANIEEKNLAEAVRTVGKHLKNVHASENDRGIPGSGHIDWPGVVQALREIGYQEFLTIEGFGFTMKEIAAATCIWRDIAPTPEAIPFEGVKFLRKLIQTTSPPG
jgi:D-psicose/D-tagatose/L-ribulose 3-epimerase